jgi:hypothetical protein
VQDLPNMLARNREFEEGCDCHPYLSKLAVLEHLVILESITRPITIIGENTKTSTVKQRAGHARQLQGGGPAGGGDVTCPLEHSAI